jgi:hypothetical protein
MDNLLRQEGYHSRPRRNRFASPQSQTDGGLKREREGKINAFPSPSPRSVAHIVLAPMQMPRNPSNSGFRQISSVNSVSGRDMYARLHARRS